MNCYYHDKSPAVGVCRSCLKGLCRQCAVDLGKGLACKDHCEQDVKELMALVENNTRLSPISVQIIQNSRRTHLYLAGFYILLGMVFAVWGVYVRNLLGDIMGVCFLAFGLIRWVQSMSIGKSQKA